MAGNDRELLVFVGCYTTADRKGRGEGITAYRMNRDSGEWQAPEVVAKVANPSFLAVHPNGRFLYCVHGGAMSEVSAFGIAEDGSAHLDPLGTRPSGGVNPVHLAVQPGGKWLVVANYTGGTATVLPVGSDGSLGAATHVETLSGPCGPDPVEQSAPHPHDIPFDPSGAFAVVPDKGLDRAFIFKLDLIRGRLTPANPPLVVSAPGAGPRHIAFHPQRQFAYVINELNSSITAYAFEPGGDGFRELQTLPSVPRGVTARTTGSEIVVHPSGRFVYVSNRGHDSVGVFAINASDGKLSPIGWVSSGGDTPRAIALDPSGRFLYAANQASDSIVGFSVDEETGELSPMGQMLQTGSPSTLVFVFLDPQ